MTISLFRLDLKVRQDCGGKADGRIPQTSEGRDAFRSPDEIAAIQVYDLAAPTVRRMLKLVWGTEAPHHTAVPLSCIAQPFPDRC